MESKAKKNINRKTKSDREIIKSKDNPGKITNRPIGELAEKDFYEIRIVLLEMEKIQAEMNSIAIEIDRNSKQNQLLQMRLREIRRKEQQIKQKNEEIRDEIKKRTGIDLKGKSIDFITHEVFDDIKK